MTGMMLKLQNRVRDLEKERAELNRELEKLKNSGGRERSDTAYSGDYTFQLGNITINF